MRWLPIVLAACSAPPAVLSIERVTPDYGPLVGGTRVTITCGELAPAPTRVFVAGREAPLASVLDDRTLAAVIPPGDRPGDAELVVVNDRDSVVATGVFRYSTEPSITSVAPADVVFRQPTTVTVTGRGFLDEDAGPPTVIVDGVPVETVAVISDTELSFVAPDRPLGKPRVEIANTRGHAKKERAFRYRPSAGSGLILFPRFSQPFAIFYDPRDGTRVEVPRVNSRFVSAVVAAHDGELWAVEGATNQVGRIDLGTQHLEQTLAMQARVSAMVRVGDTIYAVDRWSARFGSFDLDAVFTPIGPNTICCNPFGLAADGTTLYVAYRSGADQMLATIDRDTGALGTPVKITGATGSIEELRFFAGGLYATTRNNALVRIDLSTNAATLVTSLPRANAMEVFD